MSGVPKGKLEALNREIILFFINARLLPKFPSKVQLVKQA
jgi:hypothetical protein